MREIKEICGGEAHSGMIACIAGNATVGMAGARYRRSGRESVRRHRRKGVVRMGLMGHMGPMEQTLRANSERYLAVFVIFWPSLVSFTVQPRWEIF